MDRQDTGLHTKATGTYGIKSWREQTWEGKDHKEVSGTKLTHAHIVYTFEGDFTGEGEIQLLMAYLDDANATFTGWQRMVGRLGDLDGSFVMKVEGKYENGAASSTWTVIPGMGSGDLADLRGVGESVAQHADTQPFSIDYYFES